MSDEQENIPSRVPDRNVKHETKKLSSNANLIKSIKEAEEIAEYVKNSDTFGIVFKKKVELKDSKGNVLLDENNKPLTKWEINKNDIIIAIVAGAEIGLSPIQAIAYGKQLDQHAYTKVMKGRALGLDPITSLDMINIISTSNGDITHTGINVIAGALARNNITIEILEDAVVEYAYFRAKDGADLGTDLKDNYFVITPATTADTLKTANTKGDIIVRRKIKDVKTTVRLSREGKPPMCITYRRSQAIEADLYKGTKEDGSDSKGKPNWNNHPETMLRNRAVTIAGRIYAGDVLQGTYSHEEAQEIIDIQHEEV